MNEPLTVAQLLDWAFKLVVLLGGGSLFWKFVNFTALFGEYKFKIDLLWQHFTNDMEQHHLEKKFEAWKRCKGKGSSNPGL